MARRPGLASHLVAAATMLVLCSPYLMFLGHGLVIVWALQGWWVACILIGPKIRLRMAVVALAARRLELSLFLCWITVIALNLMAARGVSADLHLEYAVTGLIVFAMAVYYSAVDRRSYLFILIVALAMLSFDAVRSLPAMIGESTIVRDSVFDASSSVGALQQGIGEYHLYTANAVMFPCFLAVALARRRIWRPILLTGCGCIALAIVVSTLTVAFLMLLIGVLLFALLAALSTRRRTLAIMGVAIILSAILSFAVPRVRDLRQVQFVVNKAMTVAINVSDSGIVEGDSSGRGVRLAMSAKTFLEHPLFGIGPHTLRTNPALNLIGGSIGGHASWFDQPAEYGIFGFGFYVAFLAVSVWRVVARCLSQRPGMADIARVVCCGLFVATGFADPVVLSLSITALFYAFVIGYTPTLGTARRPSQISGRSRRGGRSSGQVASMGQVR